jgi:2-polyprenyl-6-methoxyphenol hydroxylase-like FAD-dependent oxidoreductase
VEGGRWIITVFGAGGDHPPTDEQGWREFAKSLNNPDLDTLIATGTPIEGVGVRGFKGTENRRTEYASMARWPEGLVALGDSVAAFNPVFGQGMTVSVLEARALGQELARAQTLDGMALRFQKRVAAIVRLPWLMSTSEDLVWHYYRQRSSLPLWLRPAVWYKKRLIRLVVDDPDVFRLFIAVFHMLKSPAALGSPRVMAKVFFKAGRISAPAAAQG